MSEDLCSSGSTEELKSSSGLFGALQDSSGLLRMALDIGAPPPAGDFVLPLKGSSGHQNQIVGISFLSSLLSSKRSSGVLRLLHAT